jgi:hypothetical protein
MKNNRQGWLAAVAIASVAWLWTTPLHGQRRPADPRDLQGTWDVATMTPLERPAEFKGRAALTAAEAKAMEEYEARRQEQAASPDDPNRSAPPVGGDTSPTNSFLEQLWRGGGGVVGGYNQFWVAMGSTVTKVNGEYRTSIVVDPPDGRIPTMIPAARERNEAYARGAVAPGADESSSSAGPATSFDNPEQRPLAERCLLGFGSTSGPPTLPNYFYNNLKQIVQTPTTVTILNEMVHDARVVRIGAAHLPPSVRRWNGDSIGHWDGNTLVVDTTNFTEKTQFQGASSKLHVVERFTRIDDKALLYRFTIEDPDTWGRPWTGEYPWVATDEQIYEYACHEGNHAMENMLSGARARDREEGRR